MRNWWGLYVSVTGCALVWVAVGVAVGVQFEVVVGDAAGISRGVTCSG